jgi:integrase/recombinase XerD
MVRTQALFELSIHSGLRLSEYPGIDKADIDWDTHEIRVVNSKTRETERVYFNGADVAIRKYLTMRKDGNEALFVTHDGRRITSSGLKAHFRLVKKRIKEAGGFDKSFASHISRKTFCTHLVLNSKADLKTIQRLARHKSIRTTINHYVALDEKLAAKVHKRAMGKL